MDTHTHYFLALPIPMELKEKLSLSMKNMKNELPFTRWVHPDDLHLTLAFLGRMEPSQKKRIMELLPNVVKQHEPFTIVLNNLGTFGNPQSPRIFWYGVEESEQLFSLRKSVYDVCQNIGFTLDTRPFHPHITLARKWKGPGSMTEDKLQSSSSLSQSFQVNNVILYETHLDRMPKYEEKEEFPLI
ncbi:2'-5'-RNA ligase [Bacillus sp. THAF10]|nr:2'-5'-RNA ligase [Bacillus sp. THAF10]